MLSSKVIPTTGNNLPHCGFKILSMNEHNLQKPPLKLKNDIKDQVSLFTKGEAVKPTIKFTKEVPAPLAKKRNSKFIPQKGGNLVDSGLTTSTDPGTQKSDASENIEMDEINFHKPCKDSLEIPQPLPVKTPPTIRSNEEPYKPKLVTFTDHFIKLPPLREDRCRAQPPTDHLTRTEEKNYLNVYWLSYFTHLRSEEFRGMVADVF